MPSSSNGGRRGVVTARRSSVEVPEEADRRSASSRSATELVFGVGSGIASIVYGTITAMATVTAFGNERHPWKLAQLVVGTALVLWIAHLYAHGLSESISLREPLRPEALASIARREFGIVLAAVLPTTALVLGALGVLRESSAVWLALGIGLATLAVEGARYARLEGFGFGGTSAAIAGNVALGLLVVALKVALSH
jgi:hypothetical protein